MVDHTEKHLQYHDKVLPVRIWILILLVGLTIGMVSPSTTLTIFLGIVALGSVGVMIVRPWYITYLLIVSFPFISTLPRGLLPLAFKLDELLILFGIFAFFVSPSTTKKIRLSRIDIAFIALLLAGIIFPLAGMIIRNNQPNWLEMVALVKPYLLYRVVVLTIDNRTKFSRALNLLLLPTILVSLLALMQLLNIFNTQTHLAAIYYDTPAVQVLTRNVSGLSRFLRATSTLGNWNALGSYSALAAFLGVALWGARSTNKLNNIPAISVGSALASLTLAGSSSSFVGFITGSLVLAIMRLKTFRLRKYHLISMLFIVLSLGVLYGAIGQNVLQDQITRQSSSSIYDRASQQYYPTNGFPASVVVRWYLADHLVRLMLEDKTALVTGFGKSAFSESLLPWGTAESGYVGMFFFYGPIYVLSYLGFMLTVLFYSLRLRHKYRGLDKVREAVTTALAAMVVAMLVMNLISSYYSAAGTSHLFIITVALMMSNLGNGIKEAKSPST
jgi:hypothetical protein